MKKFESPYSRGRMWSMALLLSAVTLVTAGCGGGGGRDAILGATVAKIGPTVTSVAPANKAEGVPNNTKVITAAFSKAMDPATLTPASFTLACPSGTPVTGGVVTYLAAGNVATLTLPATPDLPTSTVCIATVTTVAKDIAGVALASNFVWSFTTGATADTTRPRVTLTVPATTIPGPTADVPINTAITAVFTEDMAPLTITTPPSFTVTGPGATPVPGNVIYVVGAKTAEFTPSSVLAVDTIYTATITTAATDLAGNQLAGNQALLPAASNYVWTFKTATVPGLDATAPTVTITNPVHQEINVPINKTINATFSEVMKQSTIITTNFTVKETVSANNVLGTVAYDVQNNIATFTPQNDLTPDTDYTVTVTNGATDLAGNALVVPSVGGLPKPNPWTFRTAATPVPPQPLAINLRGAATFGVASRAGLTSTGVTVVNGDVALYPTATCTDSTGNAGASQDCLVKTYSSSTGMTVNGSIYWAGDPFDNGGTANSVTNDLNIAWTEGKNKVPTMPTVAGDQLSSPIAYLPGVYHNATLGLEAGGVATMDANNDENAIFIFQVDSSFVDSGTLLQPTEIKLINGAKARNVWFVTGLDITIGSGTKWNGTILAGRSATVNNGSTVNGRVLAGASGAGAFVLTGAASPSVTTITVPQ